MKHDEFIGQVQARARLSSRGDAERMTRATLETLGERIPEGLAENIAAQLPVEIGEHLRRTITLGGTGRGERFNRDEFIARVSSRSTTDEPLAAYGIRVVLELVAEATSGGLMAKLQESLPDGLRESLLAGSSGDVR
jgi:uncharacterized protein (DUF2267 family)